MEGGEFNPLHVLSGQLTVGWTDRFRLLCRMGFHKCLNLVAFARRGARSGR